MFECVVPKWSMIIYVSSETMQRMVQALVESYAQRRTSTNQVCSIWNYTTNLMVTKHCNLILCGAASEGWWHVVSNFLAYFNICILRTVGLQVVNSIYDVYQCLVSNEMQRYAGRSPLHKLCGRITPFNCDGGVSNRVALIVATKSIRDRKGSDLFFHGRYSL